MTQQPRQLKFGDRVRCKQTGAEGLIIDTGKVAAWIIWQGQKCSNFYAYGTFEPIPHPDTVRLDWLADPRKQNRQRHPTHRVRGTAPRQYARCNRRGHAHTGNGGRLKIQTRAARFATFKSNRRFWH